MSPLKDTIVIDLDGTLANLDHRLHYMKTSSPDYRRFFAEVAGDGVNAWCRELARAFYGKFKVVLVSGRPITTLEDTRRWLETFEVPYDELFLLRGDQDYRPDQDLKRNWLHAYGKDRILFTVDDRQKVVDMWRNEGVVCLQCAQWAEFKPEKKKRT